MKWLVSWESSGQMIVEADNEEDAKEFILTMDEDELRSHESEFEIEANRISREE